MLICAEARLSTYSGMTTCCILDSSQGNFLHSSFVSLELEPYTSDLQLSVVS